MKKIYIHEGGGHYIGSTVIVCSESLEDAELLIRKQLDGCGLMDEELDIREMKLIKNSVIYMCDGNY